MSKPPNMYPPLTRAERQAQNKAREATLYEAREAAKAEREAARRAERARVQAEAEARAKSATQIAHADGLRNAGEVRQVAKAMTPRMMEILAEIAENPMQQASGRVAAANAIIDRGHGKAIQPVAPVPGDVFDDMDDTQLDAYLRRNIDHVRTDGQRPATRDTSRALEAPKVEDQRAAGGTKGPSGPARDRPSKK